MSHRGSLGGQICSEEHLVPANKTGLVIGKGPTPSHLLSSADHQSLLQEEKPSNRSTYNQEHMLKSRRTLFLVVIQVLRPSLSKVSV